MHVGYAPPRSAIDLALGTVGIAEVLELPPFEHLGPTDVADVLDGFGRFAAEVLAPTNRVGDVEGSHLDPATGRVVVPEPMRDAFARWVTDGWPGLAVPADLGGGGLPALVGIVTEEMFGSANMALSLNPMLTQSGIHLLARWGDDEQRATYLPKLVSGEWTGTMAITEPDAGSDIGAVRTRAVPRSDGRWELTGTKIFITWGEHDLAANIVHLVLARTPNAPDGTRGLSLFVVPRDHLDAEGNPGPRNGVRCLGTERKLGIHGSPTCTLELDAAVGELVGPELGGLAAMFTAMNAARLAVGLQGLSVGERAYQQALAYATERTQGRAAGSDPGAGPAPIIDHPDVRRMLLLMASGIDAMRLLLYTTAAATDAARSHPDEHVREAAAARVDLLTPIAKAWATDEGVRITSLALQIHGGSGFIEETGAAQHYRDARIAPIYEGTNGIQAIDLAGRKVRRDHGLAMQALLDELAVDAGSLAALDVGLRDTATLLHDALQGMTKATSWLLAAEGDDWLAGATPYLELAALTIAGGLLARQAAHAHAHADAARAAAAAGRLRFFVLERLVPASALIDAITSGAARLDRSHLS